MAGLANQYAYHVARNLGDVPKNVLGALAFSLAMRLTGDDPALAVELLREEWRTLHQNGIVPQPAIRACASGATKQQRGN